MKLFHLVFLMIPASTVSCQKEAANIADDFWIKGSPADHAFDAEALNAAVNNAKDLNNCYALLVIRDQRLVVEEYFKGKNANSLFHLRSITKNVTAALTGIALEEGFIDNINDSLKMYYPDLVSGPKETIRIRDLLNMTSGLEWDENAEISNVVDNKVPQPVTYLLSRQLSDPPGSRFNYNSLSTHVAGQIISGKAGMPLRDYANEALFEPLGINNFQWQRDPEGADWGGFGLQLRARDLAKFGQLFLNRGSWQGEQVVPRKWVEASFTQQVQTSSPNNGYSYHWWISRSFGDELYYGQGYGGQALILVPEKNLMVVAFQEYLVPADQAGKQWNDFVQGVLKIVYEAAE